MTNKNIPTSTLNKGFDGIPEVSSIPAPVSSNSNNSNNSQNNKPQNGK